VLGRGAPSSLFDERACSGQLHSRALDASRRRSRCRVPLRGVSHALDNDPWPAQSVLGQCHKYGFPIGVV
jgi:hypothetical protein